MSEDQIQFKPSSAPRPNAVYASYTLIKCLRYAAKREECTVEDLFEREMTAYVLTRHPMIVSWVEGREAEEKEFLKTLKPNKQNE